MTKTESDTFVITIVSKDSFGLNTVFNVQGIVKQRVAIAQAVFRNYRLVFLLTLPIFCAKKENNVGPTSDFLLPTTCPRVTVILSVPVFVFVCVRVVCFLYKKENITGPT